MSALGQKRTCAPQNVMSALPPEALICSAPTHVRFGPIADIALFNHLVGERDQRGRYVRPRAFGGLKVKHKIELGSLNHRQIGGSLAFQNSGGVDTSLTVRIGNARPIAHQATYGDELA